MHWTPVHDFCRPCQLNFTHVVAFETFDRDQKDVLRKAGLEGKVMMPSHTKVIISISRSLRSRLAT